MMYVVEIKYLDHTPWFITAASETETEANRIRDEKEQKLRSWMAPASFTPRTDARISEMKVPDSKEELFDMLTDRLVYEGTDIDEADIDVDDDSYAIHIVGGDWKHDHLAADHLMSLFGFMRKGIQVTDDGDGDCFSAWRSYSSAAD